MIVTVTQPMLLPPRGDPPRSAALPGRLLLLLSLLLLLLISLLILLLLLAITLPLLSLLPLLYAIMLDITMAIVIIIIYLWFLIMWLVSSGKGEVLLTGVGSLRHFLILSENSACQVPICTVAA